MTTMLYMFALCLAHAAEAIIIGSLAGGIHSKRS